MGEAIANIWRRPLRTALTILGIVIGVFALTVMGALAEKLNVLVDGGDEYFRTRIFVFDEGAASGFQASSRPITRNLVDRVRRRHYTRGEGEFVDLTGTEALRRITAGARWFAQQWNVQRSDRR